MSAGIKPRTALAAILATTTALLALAAPAAATRTVEAASKITIGSEELRFHGRVSSPTLPPCRESRKVVLFKVVHGGPDEPVGHATTNRRGVWSVTVPGFAGISLTYFYAKVKRSSEGAAGTIYVCDAARSRAIRPG